MNTPKNQSDLSPSGIASTSGPDREAKTVYLDLDKEPSVWDNAFARLGLWIVIMGICACFWYIPYLVYTWAVYGTPEWLKTLLENIDNFFNPLI